MTSSIHTIKQGDALELMKRLPDKSVDAITSEVEADFEEKRVVS